MFSVTLIASLLSAVLASTAAPAAHGAAPAAHAAEEESPGYAGDDLYNGLMGPARWGFEANPTCQGLIQSPINIDESDADFTTKISGVFDNSAGAKPETNYAAGAGGVLVNLVDTWKYVPGTGSDGTFTRNDGTYSLIQWHIHSMSEHRIGKVPYPAEIHFVHKKQNVNNTVLAVIGIMVQVDAASSPFISSLINVGKNIEANEASPKNASFTPDYSALQVAFKKAKKIYRYTGSLTTPPCTEGVKWHVLSPQDALLTISVADFNTLKSHLMANYRNTMPLYMPADAGWVDRRKSDYYV